MKQIAALDPANYRRHLIHGENRVWAETNCYSDVIIELLHGLGHEPIAALPFALAIDFEGDQWTFFKFPDADIRDLFGLDICELAPWRPLVEHIEEQVGLGRPVLVELDSYFLPDTAGTAYKLAHVKSTVAVNAIDIAEKRLDYFHNQGFYRLEGQDFTDIFQTDGLVHERMLPPYIEFVKKTPNFKPLAPNELLATSLALLKLHLQRAPNSNPFHAFKEKFDRDLQWLLQADINVFHAYSFVTMRMYGACFELAETYLRWLEQQNVAHVANAATAFGEISQATKAFQFQLARSIARKKPLDLSPLDAMAQQWQLGMNELKQHFS
jgi:hypothetical protein